MTTSHPDRAQPKKSSLKPSTWYSLPRPIRAIFDKFPLVTYPANPSPQRFKSTSGDHVLYVWSNGDISCGHHKQLKAERSCRCAATLSPNPGCLKWQAYLLCKGIEFRVISSNNHASPSGALPFIIPASKSNIRSLPITASKIPRWIEEITKQPMEQLSMRATAYMSLIDQNIRNAWLFNLYLVQENFENVAASIYVNSQSSNGLVRWKTTRDLQAAATEMILKTRTTIDQGEIYSAADAAFEALETMLGEGKFFGGEEPDEFDVSLFAYTNPLRELEWMEDRLVVLFEKYETLYKHRNAMLEYLLRDLDGV